MEAPNIQIKHSLLKVNLYRYWKTKNSIVGVVDVQGIPPIFSLELPWKNNEPYISCIPVDNYVCQRRESSKNGIWNEAFEIMNVPSRSDILFGHIGNKPEDILGCVIFGLFYRATDFISSSKEAIDIWMGRMKDINTFSLSIYERKI